MISVSDTDLKSLGVLCCSFTGDLPCSSDVRFFRYVGTLTACHVATSLIKVMVALSEERDVAQRQDAAEANKKASKVCGHICLRTVITGFS